jgi:hypothetical protein
VDRAVRPAWGLAAAVGDGVNEAMIRQIQEKSRRPQTVTFAIIQIILLTFLSVAISQGSWRAEPKPSAQSEPAQKGFATPKEAADAFIRAAEAYDLSALKEILGPDGKDLVSSEDAVQDKNRAEAFVAKAHEKNEIEMDPDDPESATLIVGDDDWPLPIPIVKKDGKWSFDTKTGRDEILYRRIGANELDAIQICRGYVEAQQEYALEKHDGAEVNQYAQKIISTPGKHDGLAWRNEDGTLGGPIGEQVAKAIEQGYSDRAKPYHGYYFKILKGQGPAAPLGAIDFMVNGAMIGGFALAAAPADYRVTGVQTFIVSYKGIVYQKDLGPDSLKQFKEMQVYNPDPSWQRTDDNW